MPWRVTREELLGIPTEAAVLPVEITMSPSAAPVCAELVRAGGEELCRALERVPYLPVGRACAVDCGSLPYRRLILAAAPRWLTGKANEMLLLHRCWQEVYAVLEAEGCRSVAAPFLSVMYYRFPRHQAVHLACRESEKHEIETVFAAADEELVRLSGTPWRRPKIVSYVGWYHDDAIFALDNGLYARVDLRPERVFWDVVPYVEACFHVRTDPLQVPLPPEEIERLRRIYESGEW